MRKKLIVSGLSALALSLIFGLSKTENVLFADGEIDRLSLVASPRVDMAANFKVTTNYSAIRVKWDSVQTTDKHVRVIASANTDDESDVIDISDYNRIELLVKEGTNYEFFSPFLIDEDGDMFFFGTTDSNNFVAGSEWFNGKEIACPNTRLNPLNDGLIEYCNYSGCTAFKAEGKEDFVYYHFSLDNKSEKTYTDWRDGLNLNPNKSFDFSKVKACGFNMCKQPGNNEHDWDFGIVGIYARKQTDNYHLTNRLELFSAEKAVITQNNSSMWNDRVDADNNAYVYVQNNADEGKCVVTVEHNLTAQTKSIDMPVSNFVEESLVEICDIKNNEESAWLWAFAKDFEKSVELDLTGFDGWSMYVKNNSSKDVPFIFYQLDMSKTQYISGDYHLFDANSGQYLNNGKVIPANFEGYVYSLFESYSQAFLDNLNNMKNETRVVLENQENLAGVSLAITSWAYEKNVSEICKAKKNAFKTLNNINLDDYREAEKNTVSGLLESAFVNVSKASSLLEIESVLGEINSIKTDAEYKREAIAQNIADAKTEITNYVNSLKSHNVYEQSEIEELNSLLTEALSDIEKANSIEEITQKVNTWKSAGDAVLTSLQKAIQNAIDVVEGFDKTLYRLEEITQIDNLIASTVESISKCTTIEQIQTAVATFNTEVGKIKTDAQLTAEELLDAKTNAKSNIQSYYDGLVDANSYRTDEKEYLDGILSRALSDIENAITKSDISLIVSSAKGMMDDVKTDAELLAEELLVLKAEKLQEIRNYVNGIDKTLYSEENQLKISEYLSTAESNINLATTAEAVNQFVQQMKNDIDALLTLEEEKSLRGCGGSVLGISAFIPTIALLLCFIWIRRCDEKREER